MGETVEKVWENFLDLAEVLLVPSAPAGFYTVSNDGLRGAKPVFWPWPRPKKQKGSE